MYHLKLFDPNDTTEKELISFYDCKVAREKYKQVIFDKTFKEWTNSVLDHLQKPNSNYNIYLLMQDEFVLGSIDVHIANKGKDEEVQEISILLPHNYCANIWDNFNIAK